MLVDTTGGAEAGVRILTAADDTLEIRLHDARHGFGWSSDPGTIRTNSLQHVVFIVDGGPKSVSVLVDGRLCDGGQDELRLCGQVRFVRTQYFDHYDERCEPDDEIGDLTETDRLSVIQGGEVLRLRLYNCYLRTSETIGNWRAGYAG